ncbi:nucleotidyl transferase AbiEii/AbiGii toxin family protein [Candidatus Fermentibacteria bacterium]|nr:nucleotidyl transferase AbiEii/AbiGii toxin family protein [Candidatus Fermentibacteria bacterium]
MGITPFQRAICRLIAANRAQTDQAYVAGGVALNLLLDAPRISLDIDLFHDTAESLAKTWDEDRRLLTERGYAVEIVRERPSFVEALVRKGGESVLMQWTQDSAYRFFPLLTHDDLGLTLHPFDLATNKVLALAGRLEPRDWIDLMGCHHGVQRLGYLAWAACGKDPGFSPEGILNEAKRSSRYTAVEIAELSFDGPPPDVAALSEEWKSMLSEAEEIIGLLPVDTVGTCVLAADGQLFRGGADEAARALARGTLHFHPGSIRGAFPRIAA